MADRKIGLAHFAFYRGWIEGVDLAELGDRYLLSGRHLPSAKRTRRWLQDEFIAAASAYGDAALGFEAAHRLDDVLLGATAPRLPRYGQPRIFQADADRGGRRRRRRGWLW